MSAIDLYACQTPGFEARLQAARAALHDVASQYPGAVVQASSLGAEDQVVTDLIVRDALPIAIATLDTGALHDQTLELVERSERRWGVSIERHRPRRDAVLAFVARHGERAMRHSVELRQACCALRKLEPLEQLLAGRRAWVTGLRREQSSQRAAVPDAETDAAGRLKVNPIAAWSWADVWHYIANRSLPYNPLHDAFMPSIGCAPCTRAIAVGEDFRAGRWWWEQDGHKECGLHRHDEAGVAAVTLPSRPLAATRPEPA
jgi:phosphoadenosine phosphosulfate reductase